MIRFKRALAGFALKQTQPQRIKLEGKSVVYGRMAQIAMIDGSLRTSRAGEMGRRTLVNGPDGTQMAA